MRVHILGISGNGMRGIAEILKQQGHTVSGTDTGNSISKSEMRDLGFVIFDAHSPQNVKNVNLVIYSSAIANDNTEILEAHRLFIPVWSRMKAVNWLFSNKRNKIGVIGSVGKTSTVSIIESILEAKGNNSVYIGAKSPKLDKFGKYGTSDIAIIECCEYRNAFYEMILDTVVLTDITENHEDFFGSGIRNTIKSIRNFLYICKATKIYIPNKLEKYFYDFEITTYGESYDSQLRLDYYDTQKLEVSLLGRKEIFKLNKPIPKQYILKCLPAFQIALENGVRIEEINTGIQGIKLPSRRLEKKNNFKFLTSYDDNARNVEQIENTIEALLEIHRDRTIFIFLNIWGKKNKRNIEKMIYLFNKYGMVTFILDELGDAAIGKGGVEDEGIIDKISHHPNLKFRNVDMYHKNYFIEKLGYSFTDNNTIFVTCGYDRNVERFNRVHHILETLYLEGFKNDEYTKNN